MLALQKYRMMLKTIVLSPIREQSCGNTKWLLIEVGH